MSEGRSEKFNGPKARQEVCAKRQGVRHVRKALVQSAARVSALEMVCVMDPVSMDEHEGLLHMLMRQALAHNAAPKKVVKMRLFMTRNHIQFYELSRFEHQHGLLPNIPVVQDIQCLRVTATAYGTCTLEIVRATDVRQAYRLRLGRRRHPTQYSGPEQQCHALSRSMSYQSYVARPGIAVSMFGFTPMCIGSTSVLLDPSQILLVSFGLCEPELEYTSDHPSPLAEKGTAHYYNWVARGGTPARPSTSLIRSEPLIGAYKYLRLAVCVPRLPLGVSYNFIHKNDNQISPIRLQHESEGPDSPYHIKRKDPDGVISGTPVISSGL
ncbi:hypothetical protein EDB87DRAFT_1579130 [Lactarius vividus]|nr:hypothetical protein EDB87DRAFT_1579130 [Lactarius vividus]